MKVQYEQPNATQIVIMTSHAVVGLVVEAGPASEVSQTPQKQLLERYPRVTVKVVIVRLALDAKCEPEGLDESLWNAKESRHIFFHLEAC